MVPWVFISKFIKSCLLNMYSCFYVNHTSIKCLKVPTVQSIDESGGSILSRMVSSFRILAGSGGQGDVMVV